MRGAAPGSRLLAAATIVAALTGCTLEESLPGEPATVEPPTTVRGAEAPDPRVQALAGEIEDLRAAVSAAREALAQVQAAPQEAGAAAARAVALLTADQRLADTPPDELPHAPLFPGRSGERNDATDHGDTFTEALTTARDAGPAGAPLVDLLRDPLAGDLGAWQRDAEGILTAVERTAHSSPGVTTAEERVAELPGEATKALAWAVLAERTRDPDRRAAFAERGLVHLDLVLTAIDALVRHTPTESP